MIYYPYPLFDPKVELSEQFENGESDAYMGIVPTNRDWQDSDYREGYKSGASLEQYSAIADKFEQE